MLSQYSLYVIMTMKTTTGDTFGNPNTERERTLLEFLKKYKLGPVKQRLLTKMKTS